MRISKEYFFFGLTHRLGKQKNQLKIDSKLNYITIKISLKATEKNDIYKIFCIIIINVKISINIFLNLVFAIAAAYRHKPDPKTKKNHKKGERMEAKNEKKVGLWRSVE